MACQVKRNNEGNITRVSDSTGKESMLFVSIAKHPMINDNEEALKVFKNVYTKGLDEGMEFTHRTSDGALHSSYKNALLASKEGEIIEVGFFGFEKGFNPIIKISKNTNKKTEDGFLNHFIENDVISTEKTIGQEGYVLKGAGVDEVTRTINTEIVIGDAYAYLGTEGVKRLSSDSFSLSKTNDKLKLTKADGSIEYVSKRELNDMSYVELNKKYPDIAMDVIVGREFANSIPSHKPIDVNNLADVNRSEDELQLALLNLLSKMGVKVTSVSNYVKNYKTKNRVNPSARALADISNQVVALAEGTINIQDLTEETAHFINEAMPQERVVNLLRNIHKTEEWKQFSEVYRAIYAQEYQGDTLEQAVRREVLGKVIANSIKTGFSVTNKTETQGNIINNVVGLIRDFINTIKTFFKSDFKTELEEYKKNVNDLLLREDITEIINTDRFKDNKFRLYSVSPNTTTTGKIHLAATKAVRALEIQIQNSLGKENINKIKLEEINKRLEEAQEKQAVSGIVQMSQDYIRILNAAIKDSQKNNNSYLFTNEENVIYKTLTNNLDPAVAELAEIVRSAKDSTGEWDSLIDSMEEIGKDVKKMKAKATIADSGAINRLVDRIVERHNLDEGAKEYIKDWIETAKQDTNYFHSTFGQLLHSRDGLLNLAGTLITDMSNEANWEFMAELKTFQQKIKNLGVKESELKQFVDSSGKYIVSEVDQNAFEERKDEIYAEAYRRATGTDMEDADIIRMRDNRTLEELTPEQQAVFRQEERTMLNPEIERRFIPKYYEEYEKRLADNNISEPTTKFLASYYSEISDLKKKATSTVNGKEIVNYSLLSEADLEKLQQINANRKAYKSYTNEIGELKDGLEYRTENGLLYLDENNQPEVIVQENASDNAKIAVDLNRLDTLSREEFAKKEGTKNDEKVLPDAFVDMLNEIDATNGREAAIKFLNVNSYMGFSSEFWNGLGAGTSFISKLRSAKETNPEDSDTIDKYIEDIVQTNAKMKGILKLYASKNNPSEISTERMSDTVMKSVKALQESLTTLYRDASKYTKDNGESEEAPQVTGVSSANDAYITALEEIDSIAKPTDSEDVQRSKLKKEFAFATKHMTEENRKSLERNMDIVDSYLRGERITVPTKVEQILQDNLYEAQDLNDIDVYAFTIQSMIRERVLPYYKKFSPEGHSEYMEAIRSSEGLLGDTLRNTSSGFLEISPNYSFFDQQQDENRNPRYQEDYQGGYLQPNKDKYASNEFADLFGTIVDGKSTKNENLYEAYKLTLEYNKKALDDLNMGVGHNAYKLPQVRKQLVQRAKSLSTGMSADKIRSAFQEVFNFTEDDQVKGEASLNTDDIKVIPKRFVNNLEDPNDVSDDLFFSLAARSKEAALRKARVKYYGDFMSIYDKMLTRSYNGKAPESTQTVKMFKSAMDYNLFGVKETATYPVDTFFGTVDIAKIARQLLGFIKFRNLGFNLVIPLTSMITGKAMTFNEKLIGEHIHSRSVKLGNREFRTLAADGMKEFGQINTEAKINVLGQYFRAFDLDDSFANSNYGFLVRNAPRTGMALHAAANYPVYGEILMGILHDYRIAEGKITNFNAFEQAKRNEGLTKDQIKQEWNALEDQVLYKFIDVENAQVKIDKAAIGERVYDEAGEPMSDERLNEYIDNVMQGVQSFTSNVISNVDGQIPNEMRVTAQRHFLLNFFMTHRGWLSIATSRRFKNRHLNTNSGVIEEGSYRSFWNYMGRYLKEYKSSNFKNVIGSFKEAYQGADDTEKQNLKRVGIEMAMLNSLMILGFIMANAAEDEDNKELFGLQATNYLLYRTLNELSSVQLGIGNNYVDIIESPFVGLQTVENLTKVTELFDDEEVTRGRYKGMQKNEKLLLQLIPGAKQVFDLGTMNETYDTYKYYNQRNLNYSAVGKMWSEYEKSLKDK